MARTRTSRFRSSAVGRGAAVALALSAAIAAGPARGQGQGAAAVGRTAAVERATALDRAAAVDRAPRDSSQQHFYATLHPKTARTGSEVLPISFDYDGPLRRAELTVDTSGIDGVAVVTSAADGCKPQRPSFTCSMSLNPESQGSSRQEVVVRAASGAAAGDSGVLRYTLQPDGLRAVEGSVTVIAGRPELRVNKSRARKTTSVGEKFGVPILIRNIGDVPARGVELDIEGEEDLALTTRHANCRYRKDGTAARCLLPDAVIAPGRTMRVSPEQRLEPKGYALDSRFSYAAAAFDTGDEHGFDLGDHPTSGKADSLSLTPDADAGEGTAFTEGLDVAEVEVPVRNTADVTAIGASVRGKVGSTLRIRIGFRNAGPAQPHGAAFQAVFSVPPGTEVTKAPYDPELEEEMFDQECLTTDHGRTYTCTRNSAPVGLDALFAFTLRIRSKDVCSGSVAASAHLTDSSRTRVKDPEPGNDASPVTVHVAGAGPCNAAEGDAEDGPGTVVLAAWAAGGAVAAAAGSWLFIVRRRRRSTV